MNIYEWPYGNVYIDNDRVYECLCYNFMFKMYGLYKVKYISTICSGK